MFEFQSSKEFKNKRVRLRFQEDIEPQEVLLDKLAQKKEEEISLTERRLEIPLPEVVLKGILIVFLGIILLFSIKVFQLQIIKGKDLGKLAEKNKFIIYSIQANRGVIYDKDLKNQLVFNLPSFDLILEKNNLPESPDAKKNIISQVAQILNKKPDYLEKEITENSDPEMVITEGLDHQTLIILETKIDDLDGFKIKQTSARSYKDGEVFSHLIGYTGKISSEELKGSPEIYSINDYVGKEGVEKSYEEILRRNPGKLKVERDALGNVISKEIVSLPESGNSLVLWLDSELQKKIKEQLEIKINELGAKKAIGVAIDPKTGGILALVSIPTFDNNLFSKGADSASLQRVLSDKDQPLFNRVISGKYLTGSTIKPLIASAALEEKIIDPNKKFDCEGLINIPNQYNPEEVTKKLDWTTHGWTDLRKALAESCNVYFYTIGGGYGDQKGLGPTKIKDYLELFGWGSKTGIDLPDEVAGFIPDKNWKKETWGTNWWDGDTYNFAIGQGFLQITPIEIVTSFTAIANGGKLLEPQVVKSIVDSDKKLIKEFEPEIIRENFIKPENLQIIREGMRQAVTGVNSPQASSVLLNSLPVTAAAKTGTAELGNGYYNNWITVFAPYNDPQIVLTIMLENVKGVQAAVLPVAKEVLESYFNEGK